METVKLVGFIIKKCFLLFFVLFICFIFSCKDSRELKDSNVAFLEYYSSEFVVFYKTMNIEKFDFNYYTANPNSSIKLEDGIITMNWDGKFGEVLGGEYIGEKQAYYGFYIGFKENRDILDYNEIMVSLKGYINPGHVLILNVCGKDVAEITSLNSLYEDIPIKLYEEEETDLNVGSNIEYEVISNLKKDDFYGVSSLVGFILKNKYSFSEEDDLGLGNSYVDINKIVMYKKSS